MKEKSLFFSHDFGAHNDPKIQEMLMDLGASGYGIYWCLIEMLYESDGILPMTSVKRIAYLMHAKDKTVESVICNYKLFETDGTHFWSPSQRERQSKMKNIIEKRRYAGGLRQNKTPNNEQMISTCSANADQMLNKCGEDKDKDKDKDKDIITSDKSEVSDSGESASGKSDEIDYSQIVNLYHELCPSFPRILKLNPARKQIIRIRFVDEMKQDMELLKTIFTAMEKSKFLRGDNNRGWKASFDWLFENPTNWVKVAEGNYDDRQPHPKPSKKPSSENVNEYWND